MLQVEVVVLWSTVDECDVVCARPPKDVGLAALVVVVVVVVVDSIPQLPNIL